MVTLCDKNGKPTAYVPDFVRSLDNHPYQKTNLLQYLRLPGLQLLYYFDLLSLHCLVNLPANALGRMGRDIGKGVSPYGTEARGQPINLVGAKY